MKMHRILVLNVGIFSGLMWGLNDVFTKIISQHQVMPTLFAVIIFSLLLAWFQDICSAFGIASPTRL